MKNGCGLPTLHDRYQNSYYEATIMTAKVQLELDAHYLPTGHSGNDLRIAFYRG